MRKALEIVSQLADARSLAVRLYGDDYEKVLCHFRDAIRRWHKETGKPLAEVCKTLLEQTEMNSRGLNAEANMLCAMAASYEEMAAHVTQSSLDASTDRE